MEFRHAQTHTDIAARRQEEPLLVELDPAVFVFAHTDCIIKQLEQQHTLLIGQTVNDLLILFRE